MILGHPVYNFKAVKICKLRIKYGALKSTSAGREQSLQTLLDIQVEYFIWLIEMQKMVYLSVHIRMS